MAKKLRFKMIGLLTILFVFHGCATIGDITSSMVNLQKLQFKLDSVQEFSLAGITLSNKSSLKDFTVQEGIKLSQLLNSKKFPVEFTLNILAINPNDGSGNKIKTTATLSGLDARLLIDGQPTVYGDLTSPIEIPGTGEEIIIPLRMSLDLYEFFSNQGPEKLLELALAIGGKNGSTSRLALDVQPRVTTPFGEIKYPGRITIVDKEFR